MRGDGGEERTQDKERREGGEEISGGEARRIGNGRSSWCVMVQRDLASDYG